MHLCWSGTSLFEILDPPLNRYYYQVVNKSSERVNVVTLSKCIRNCVFGILNTEP